MIFRCIWAMANIATALLFFSCSLAHSYEEPSLKLQQQRIHHGIPPTPAPMRIIAAENATTLYFHATDNFSFYLANAGDFIELKAVQPQVKITANKRIFILQSIAQAHEIATPLTLDIPVGNEHAI